MLGAACLCLSLTSLPPRLSSPSSLTRAEWEKGYPNVSPVVSAGSVFIHSDREKGPLVPGREGDEKGEGVEMIGKRKGGGVFLARSPPSARPDPPPPLSFPLSLPCPLPCPLTVFDGVQDDQVLGRPVAGEGPAEQGVGRPPGGKEREREGGSGVGRGGRASGGFPPLLVALFCIRPPAGRPLPPPLETAAPRALARSGTCLHDGRVVAPGDRRHQPQRRADATPIFKKQTGCRAPPPRPPLRPPLAPSLSLRKPHRTVDVLNLPARAPPG